MITPTTLTHLQAIDRSNIRTRQLAIEQSELAELKRLADKYGFALYKAGYLVDIEA